jgi:hypothetical protein
MPDVPRSLRRRLRALRGALLPTAAWLSSAAAALAQAPAQPGGAGPTQVVQRGPGFFGEIVLVIALSGAALFAVCRSSRRN